MKFPVTVPEDVTNPYVKNSVEWVGIDNPDKAAWSKEAAIRKRR